jgi:phosphoserine aminotransferase
MPERSEIRNLAAGPSPLPTPVLEKAAKGLINYNNTGMGICELSHRSKDFKAVIEGAEGKFYAWAANGRGEKRAWRDWQVAR